MALHLRLIRKARGLSLRQLGALAGFHRSQLSRMENNYYRPTLDQLQLLAEALQVSAALMIQDAVPDCTQLPPWQPPVPVHEGVMTHA